MTGRVPSGPGALMPAALSTQDVEVERAAISQALADIQPAWDLMIEKLSEANVPLGSAIFGSPAQDKMEKAGTAFRSLAALASTPPQPEQAQEPARAPTIIERLTEIAEGLFPQAFSPSDAKDVLALLQTQQQVPPSKEGYWLDEVLTRNREYYANLPRAIREAKFSHIPAEAQGGSAAQPVDEGPVTQEDRVEAAGYAEMAELLACPLCHSTNVEEDAIPARMAICQDCGCMAPISKWNTRPPASGVAEEGWIGPKDVRWIVNSIGELGVMVRGRAFFLYKGESLEYVEPSDKDDGGPLFYRPVFKREFGECAHPINHSDPSLVGTVSLDDSDDWRPLPAPPALATGDRQP